MTYADKIINVYDYPLELRFRLEGQVGGQWFLYTGLDSTRIDIRIVGIESGEFAPELTVLPPHDQAFSSTMVWWIEGAKGSGQLNFVAEIHGSGGVLCSLAFGLYLHGTGGSEQSCRDLHPTREAINGFWWDCVDGDWVNTGEPVGTGGGKDLFPLVGQLNGFYSGSGQQSLTLELQPLPSGVGFINWEITAGPSGAFTVPLGSHPQMQCEFYYSAAGQYSVRATPFASENEFDSGKPAIGQPAVFTVNISPG
jgi:hypothetical protein